MNEEIGEEIPEEMENTDSAEESFADLFEAYDKNVSDDVRVGDKISGEIISIGRDAVFVDTGTRIDGVVEKAELLNDEGELDCKVGDVLELYAVSVKGGEIRLSKSVAGGGGLEILQDAYEESIPVEGKVKSLNKGGFDVLLGNRRAFCPISQMDIHYVEKPEDYVGEAFEFLITDFEESGRNIVLSRRKLLEKAVQKARKSFLENLVVGSELTGRVTKLMPFGAFVELTPGVEGMVHISELGWSRVEKPSDVLQVGETVMVKVLGVAPDEKSKQMKISLSIKQTADDPWLSVTDRFKEGDVVEGKVSRCAPFGAFVEIEPGIEGLVHISEMSYRKRVLKAEDVVSPGDLIQVLIKEIDSSRQRISLSMRDVEGDPWAGIAGKYGKGQPVEGTVEKHENFGIFVSLEPGVSALLPKSRIRESSSPGRIEKARPGDTIPVVIENVNVEERKISVGPGDAQDEGEWRRFVPGRDQNQGMGSLGEKLKQALAAKKKR
ncbi:putative ribosomal protein S1 [delta proteobacterium NaphS2]|nr:putative ribosomal protein S1 [delta proteobacterium NaphS2]